MKTGFWSKTIIPAMILLAWTAVQADERLPSPVPAAPASTENAAPAATSEQKIAEKDSGAPIDAAEKEKRADEEGSVTINMKVPLFSPSFAKIPVAIVNDDIIAIEELTSAIAAMHEGMADQETAARKNYSEVFNRLITIKLLVQEAENIGLDQLPEVKKLLDTFEKTTFTEILFMQQAKDVKADEKVIEQRYRAQIKEWKLVPLRFKKKADATKFVQEIKKGKSFAELADKAISEGKAQGSKEPAFVSAQGLQPEIVKAVAKLKAGSVTPVISVESGFAVVKFEETRFPENPAALEEVRKSALIEAKRETLEAFKDGLIRKYVKIDAKLLKKVDFEAEKPGFKNMLNDKRTIAEIKGEKPITVGELAKSLNEKFFHGMNIPIKEKKVNILKSEQLDNMLQKRLFHKEAQALGIDKSDEYQKRFKEYKEQIIFGSFIGTVIRKEVTVTEDDLKAYYSEHSKDKDYIYPEMIRMNGLAFTTMEAAQAGMEKLKQGVDFKWLKSTAEGQMAENTPDLLKFTGNLVAGTTLSDDLRKVLTGVHSGDFRVYADAAGHYYAIQILEIIPQRVKTFEEAKESIRNLVYDKNIKKTIDDWAKKLREAADIKLYVDFGEIN